MTLDQLKYFNTAATLLHISKAAKQENISQPSLSIALKKLENELGVPLFRNSGRNIALTSHGLEFLQYTRSILQQVEIARTRMFDQSQKINTEIRLAYTSPVASTYMPHLLKDFVTTQKATSVIYSNELRGDDIVGSLKEAHLDLAICSKLDDHPDIIQVPILYQPLVLIVPHDSPLAISEPTSLDDLCHEAFIAYHKDYPMHEKVSNLFNQINITPNISHFTYSEDAISRLVEQGLGISIVAKIDSLSNYNIKVYQPDWLKDGRFIFLTYHRHRYYGEAVRELIDFIVSNSPLPLNT